MNAQQDRPAAPCQPVCDFEQNGDMVICEHCGSLWRCQQVTEVDPVTLQPTRIQRGWVRY